MKSFQSFRAGLPKLRTLAALVAMSCTAGLSLAGEASVVINSFSYVTSGAELTWTDSFQSFDAVALNGGGLLGSKTDSFATPDWGFLAVGANTSNAIAAVSTTTPQTFFADASTTRSVGPATTPRNQASATANQSGSFMLSAPGSVTFTVGYTLAASWPGGSSSTDFSTALLSFAATDSDSTSGGNLSDQLMSFNQLTGAGSKTGQFNLTVNLGANETGFYNLDGSATSFAVAAVPEPTDFALMAGGLLTMVGVLRRRKAAQARVA